MSLILSRYLMLPKQNFCLTIARESYTVQVYWRSIRHPLRIREVPKGRCPRNCTGYERSTRHCDLPREGELVGNPEARKPNLQSGATTFTTGDC